MLDRIANNNMLFGGWEGGDTVSLNAFTKKTKLTLMCRCHMKHQPKTMLGLDLGLLCSTEEQLRLHMYSLVRLIGMSLI